MLTSAKWRRGRLALRRSCASVAQRYPNKPVRIIVPYRPARAPTWQRATSPPAVPDHGPALLRREQAGGRRQHRSGTGGALEPDGYAISMGIDATQSMNEFMYPSTRFVPEKDFAPIILIGTFPMVIAATPTLARIQWPIWSRPRKRLRTMPTSPCQARPRVSFSNS